jgi:thiol:disulfide interchange protein DsbD
MKARNPALAPFARSSPAAMALRFFLLAIALLALIALQPARAAEDEFLEPDKAFQFSARPHDAKSVEVTFAIAPGYYLYREQFKFAAAGATLGAPAIPAGKVKFDETFQKNVETYRNAVTIVVPVDQAGAEFRLVVTSQGCADAGLCYPPMQSAATIGLTGFGGSGMARVDPPGSASGGTTLATSASTAPPTTAETTGIDAVLRGGSFWPIVGAFFIAGLLLSLTPCVLPMLPIVSSIIVGQAGSGGGPTLAGAGAGAGSRSASAGQSRRRGFALAASYSFGMAVVYTAFGVIAGLAGEGLAAALQNPWVLGAFALGLVALSLSMFGVYELQMPSSISSRINDAARKLPGGKAAGVFAMGGVSALIVSPCVAAPLAGALLYLSQTRDVWLGGTALFSLAAGMSVPLLLVGASAGALLPRAGAWMVEVKAAFGVLLLGVALWTVQPIMPGARARALGPACPRRGRFAGDARSRDRAGACVGSRAAASGVAAGHRCAARPGGRAPGRRRGLGRDRSAPAARPILGTQRHRRVARHAALPARQERRRARRRPAHGRPPGDARFLRRLVRLVQGDGALHVHRARGAEEARRRAAAEGRRHGEQRR